MSNKDNVIQFPKHPHMIPGWDLQCVLVRQGESSGPENLQKALDEGFEPFSITTYQELSQDILTKQPKAVMVDKVWLKRPVAPVPADLDPGPAIA